ncbi:L,D-transpeptidase [Nocardioidaceae bacterium]|nr:L,D-transpeptidase [Nocardioidaceae bacterium]
MVVPEAVRTRPRVRYARISALVSSVAATAVATLGPLGVVDSATLAPTAAEAAEPAEPAGPPAPQAEPSRGAAVLSAAESTPYDAPIPTPSVEPVPEAPLPADSGEGRRAVFSESQQRVWLVGRGGEVRRTYPVSGSIYDNLDPGSYEVFSRSEQAYGIDDSGEMRFFVRFTVGDNAAIGFHSIPTKDGRRLQTRAELGTPTSHGCIRQALPDAKAMWRFAQLGDAVVVVA